MFILIKMFKKINNKLKLILDALALIISNQEHMMSQLDEVQAYAARIDAATNEIAADLQILKDALAAAGSLTDESKATLESVIGRLEGLGQEQ